MRHGSRSLPPHFVTRIIRLERVLPTPLSALRSYLRSRNLDVLGTMSSAKLYDERSYIDKRQLRLLYVHDAADAEENVSPLIRCSLKLHNMDEGIPYTALSYMWGTTEGMQTVLVNDYPFQVSKNLFDFLQIYQHDQQRRPVWVDQVCINQADDEERSEQVAMMADIYRGAYETLAWLGCDPERKAAVQLLSDFYEAHRPSRRHAWCTDKDGERFLAVTSIAGSSYWTRHWIAQEVILSKQSFFVCGSAKLNLWHFAAIKVFDIDEARGKSLATSALTKVLGFIPTVGDSMSTRRFCLLFAMAERSSCRDLRGKIYGSQGLLHEALHIQPDYTRSVSVTYWSAIEHYFHQSGWVSKQYVIDRWSYLRGVSDLATAMNLRAESIPKYYLEDHIFNSTMYWGTDLPFMSWDEMRKSVELSLRAPCALNGAASSTAPST